VEVGALTNVMVGDIGGTNARFALLRNGRIGTIRRVPTSTLTDTAHALAAIAAEMPARVDAVAFAAAGPKVGNTVSLTNAPVRLDADELRKKLRLRWAVVENDLGASARGLPALTARDLRALHRGEVDANATRVVVGPGTGLGVAAVTPAGQRNTRKWAVISGEGGHANAALALNSNLSLCSWEDVLSGPGLLRLYQAAGGDVPTPDAVTAKALAGEGRAKRVISAWCRMLGSCCGDMVLLFGARGGCYVAGGLVRALGRTFDRRAFVAGYCDKRDFRDYVAGVPVWRITHRNPVMVGLRELVRERDGA